jgi:SMODS-associating 2TM, beta-strand rich effector domain
MWDGIDRKLLATFVLAVGGAAALVQWLIVRTADLASLWGYVGTASIGVTVALTAFDKWLWRLKVGDFRVFAQICRKPDISGRWVLSMQPIWGHLDAFDQSLEITQTLFSLSARFDRNEDPKLSAAYSESLAADLIERNEQWLLVCVYESKPGFQPEEHTAAHDGCLVVDIRQRKWNVEPMRGRYWTNKTTSVTLSRLVDDSRRNFDPAVSDLWQLPVPLHATAGSAVIRHCP